jgi:hypothetical protein
MLEEASNSRERLAIGKREMDATLRGIVIQEAGKDG